MNLTINDCIRIILSIEKNNYIIRIQCKWPLHYGAVAWYKIKIKKVTDYSRKTNIVYLYKS